MSYRTRSLQKALLLSAFLMTAALAPLVPLVPAFAASPQDQGRMVFDRDGDIYTSSANGSAETALTQNGDSHSPKWSPDGQHILFIRNTSLQMVTDADGNVSEIGQPTDFYIMDRDGKNAHLLKHFEGVVSDPSWAPDGKTIGFYFQSKEEWLNQGIPAFQAGYFELAIDGDSHPKFISSEARHVDWAPNGKRIVFSVMRPGNHMALHTATPDGNDETQLLDEEIFANADGAKWSADSSQLAFQATVRRPMPGNKMTFQSTIFIVHPDGTHIRQLTYDLGWDCWNPYWSHTENVLTYSCYAMPQCTPASAKKHPDQCIGRTFTLAADDPHAKPVQVNEQKGVAGSVIPELSAK